MIFELMAAALAVAFFVAGWHLGRKSDQPCRDIDLFAIGEEGISMRVRKGTTRDDIVRFLNRLLESEHFKCQGNSDSREDRD